MSTVEHPIRFGDVVKLQTRSSFVKASTPAAVGFLDLPGKIPTQLLVVPPVAEDAQSRFQEAEFIVTPIRGPNQPNDGDALTYQTPFVLRTSDDKDGTPYTLNNKVPNHNDAISLSLSASKGEMYIQVEKEGRPNTTTLNYGEDGLNIHVIDSNRVRKTMNHLLTHVVKPKTDAPGGVVTCGTKGSALTFTFQRAVDAGGKPLTETPKFVKSPKARGSSKDLNDPTKSDELGRAGRVGSGDFSSNRSSSMAQLGSKPASPPPTSRSNSAAVLKTDPKSPQNADAKEASAKTPAKDTEKPAAEIPASPSKAQDGDTKAAEVAAVAVAVTTNSAASPSKNADTGTKPDKKQSKKEKSKPTKAEPAVTEPGKVEVSKADPPKPEKTKAKSSKGKAADKMSAETKGTNPSASTSPTTQEKEAEQKETSSSPAKPQVPETESPTKSPTKKSSWLKSEKKAKQEAPAKTETAKESPTKTDAKATSPKKVAEKIETATISAKPDSAKAAVSGAMPVKTEQGTETAPQDVAQTTDAKQVQLEISAAALPAAQPAAASTTAVTDKGTTTPVDAVKSPSTHIAIDPTPVVIPAETSVSVAKAPGADVAGMKAEAESEDVKPVCTADCSVM